MAKKYNNTEFKTNESILPEFVDICKMSQKDLKKFLKGRLLEVGYENIVSADGYLYAKGELPILLTAHMDTVHVSKIKNYFEVSLGDKHKLYSPQGIGGDDRCGIYSILEIIKEKKCSVLFCEDEERGGVGSKKFLKSKYMKDLSGLKYMIELDRANEKDAVFYYCDNKKFTEFICSNTGYKESYGSFSDISVLAPEAGVAAVNLSCGYYNAHTTSENVVIEEMLNTIEVVKKLLDVDCEQFEYIKKKYSYGSYWSKWSNEDNYYNYSRKRFGYDRNTAAAEEDDDYDYYSGAVRRQRNLSSFGNYRRYGNHNDYDQIIMFVTYVEADGYTEREVRVSGSDKDELWRKFFHENSSVCMDRVLDYYFDYV